MKTHCLVTIPILSSKISTEPLRIAKDWTRTCEDMKVFEIYQLPLADFGIPEISFPVSGNLELLSLTRDSNLQESQDGRIFRLK